MLAHFAFPTRVVSGPGALATLPQELARLDFPHPLVVTDPGLVGTPAFQQLLDVLHGYEVEFSVFSKVHPNPTEEDVVAAALAFATDGCDAVIGFGGGSALDVAKIVRLADAREDWRTLTWETELEDLWPMVAIPTTAGTGSEVGRSSVITFEQTKRVLFHPKLLPELVLLEPGVTAGLPPHLTAATGVDALTHCIEAYTSPVAHPLCEAIALEGARLVFENLPRVVTDGAHLEARSQMQIAAMMGGIAFQKDLGAAHSLSHPLSARFGVHHGLANGLVLPAVMRWNEERLPEVYERLGIVTGKPNFRAAVERLLAEIGVVGRLRDHGVSETDLPVLAAGAFADSCHRTNPVPVTVDDLFALYKEVW